MSSPYEFELNGLKVVVYAENKEKAKEIFVQKTIEHNYFVHTNAIDTFARELFLLIRTKTINCFYDFTLENLNHLEKDINTLAEQIKSKAD